MSVIVASLAGLPTPSWAQQPLTLDAAVQATLTHNASLRAARAGVDEARAQADVARGVFFPRISLGESWQRGNEPVYVFSSLLSSRRFSAANFAIDALNEPRPLGFFRASVGLDQIVFDAGRRSASRAAAVTRQLADASASELALQLAVATTETFGRVMAAQATAQAAHAARDGGREDLARAQNRREAGMATDADVLALVVHVADLEQRLIQAEGDAATARTALNRLMGAPIDREFLVVEPPSPPAAVTLDTAALLREAEAARPDLQRVALAERLAEIGRQQARAALIPTVAAHAGLDVSGLRFSQRASAWAVGGELRWSFSTGGSELAQLKAAASAQARAQAERDDARAAAHVDVVAALRRLQTAHARQAAGRAAVEQAREAERIVRNRFEAGMASVSDVLRAATALLDAEAHRSAALVEAIVSTALLNQALGRRPS